MRNIDFQTAGDQLSMKDKAILWMVFLFSVKLSTLSF